VTQTLLTLREAIMAYQQRGYRLGAYGERLDDSDVSMLDRLLRWEAAPTAFAALTLSENKGLILIDDCVTAHRIDTGEHKAQVERLRKVPDHKKMVAKLDALEKYIGTSSEHDIEAVRMMRVALYYRHLHHEYDRRSTSRKGDKASARSRAIGWLKESVRRLSGQDNFERVATLCDAVLNTDDAISLDSVKRALTPREWLDRRY
jgi:hypothetical protein